MKPLSFFFCLSFILLCVGCRSSRTGASHTTTQSDLLEQSRSDSINFVQRFGSYLHQQESKLTARIIKYYPPTLGDTAAHGPIASITNLDLNHKEASDSTIDQKNLTTVSDTTSRQTKEKTETQATLTIQPVPWYQPFIPYMALGLLLTLIYYLRRPK